MIRITILSLFLFFSSNRIFSQDFYINDNSEIQFLSYLISPEWSNLNLNESIEFLKNSGFKEVKSTNKYNFEVVSGKITNNNYIFYRELAFENKIIKSYSDVIVFFQPSYKYLASPLKDMGSSFENQYQDALKKDEKIKDLFLKYYSQSIKKDGITAQILGDITDIGFDFSNSISTPDFEILRNCKSRLEQNKIFNYYSSRQVLIKEKEYLVGDNDLKKINEYDLNKMVDVFLLDCKNNNILLKKGKVIVSFESLPSGILGLSYGYNDNTKIELKVDPEKWANAPLPKKWYLIYHELGHDVLNLNHGNGGKMMFNFSEKGYSWKEFWEDRTYMFNSIKK